MEIEIDRLLYEPEGTTLDFKSNQYRFVESDPGSKSELLKDILGFSNGFNRGLDCYILIGVEEVRGGKSKVIGIEPDQHLDDHSLQEFVNSKTNKTIDFSYFEFEYDEKSLGVIVIRSQKGPFYLKKNYGRLKKNDVYVRRGSSIDISNPASPDEIAGMVSAATSERLTPDIHVEFIDKNFDHSLGDTVSLEFEKCEVPSQNDLPLFREERHGEPEGPLNQRLFRNFDQYSCNRDYYKELAYFEAMRRWMRPVKLAIENVGKVAALDTRIEMNIPVDGNLLILGRGSMPQTPKKFDSFRVPNIDVGGLRARREPGDVTVKTNGIDQSLAIDCLDLQPGRKIYSERFFIGINNSGKTPLGLNVLSSSFDRPSKKELFIEALVCRTELTFEELVELPEPWDGVFDV